MDAKQLLDGGDLQGAIDQLSADVKASPLDLQKRIFLFEVLCFTADFRRAERQLDAVAQISGDVKVKLGVDVYRRILQAEDARKEILNGENRQPKFLFEPPSYTALHLKALSELKDHHPDEVETLLNESSRMRKNIGGRIDDVSFADFRDGDDLLAPFVEAIIHADYVWLPIEQLAAIEIQAPRTLRDLLWIPAKVEFTGQQTSDVFIPVRYYGSSDHPQDSVKLGRMTIWQALGEEANLGTGQRTFLIDDDERSLLELRKVDFMPS